MTDEVKAFADGEARALANVILLALAKVVLDYQKRFQLDQSKDSEFVDYFMQKLTNDLDGTLEKVQSAAKEGT